jgi:hypothetical protein
MAGMEIIDEARFRQCVAQASAYPACREQETIMIKAPKKK